VEVNPAPICSLGALLLVIMSFLLSETFVALFLFELQTRVVNAVSFRFCLCSQRSVDGNCSFFCSEGARCVTGVVQVEMDGVDCFNMVPSLSSDAALELKWYYLC